jgi:hypothetical protein
MSVMTHMLARVGIAAIAAGDPLAVGEGGPRSTRLALCSKNRQSVDRLLS